MASQAADAMQVSQHIYRTMKDRLGSRYLFGISRTSDFKVISYELLCHSMGNVHESVAMIKSTDMSSKNTPHDELPSESMLVKRFFGLSRPTWKKDRTSFTTSLVCLPERKIEIKPRQNKNPVVYISICGKKKCHFLNAQMDISFHSLTGMPDLKRITIVGFDKGRGELCSETIEINDDVMQKVNKADLFKEYMSEKLKYV